MASNTNSKIDLKTKSAIKQESLYQAVIIADSFDQRFASLTTTTARVLIPLLNRPLLSYSLEWLSVNGFHEVFIFSCSHSAKIRSYVNQECKSLATRMTVSVFSSESFMSMGDVLRDLDSKALIKSDFALIFGDAIGNVNLVELIEKHKRTRLTDKTTVMTMVYREADPGHASRSIEGETIAVVNGETNRLLHYEKVTKTTKKIDVPLSVFQDNKSVKMHYNLLDPNVTICSVVVPPLFTDNFDYQTRDDLIKGLFVHEEIVSNSIYIHIAKTGYMARISNPTRYDRVSKDLLHRWIFPVVPDMRDKYSYNRHHIYKHCHFQLALDSHLKGNVAIGATDDSSIGSHVSITDTVIGSRCKIGDNVTLESCYVFDDVVIESNCTVNSCILSYNVVLKSNTKLGKGCLIGEGVIIGPNVDLKEGSIIQKNGKDSEINKSLVGQEGQGYLYSQDSDSDGELGDDIRETWGQELNMDDDDDDDDMSDHSEISEKPEEEDLYNDDDNAKLFYAEIVDGLQRGIEEKIKCENLILDINSSKHAYNIPIKEVNALLVKAVVDLPASLDHSQDRKLYFQHLKPILDNLTPLIKNYIRSAESQCDCLIALEEYSFSNPDILTPNCFVSLMHYLYDKDIIDEEVIIGWHTTPTPLQLVDVNVDEQKHLRDQQRIKTFIEWLNKAEEETSDDD